MAKAASALLRLGNPLPRRTLLRGGLAGLAAAVAVPYVARRGEERVSPMKAQRGPLPARAAIPPPPLQSRMDALGPLGRPDALGLRLPPGFSSRIVARSGARVSGSDYVWHANPDGGATFATENGGWIYASNSETPIGGGAGTLRFDRDGELVGGKKILAHTNRNCAGGSTPWQTWLSCEESPRGRVFETDPWGEEEAMVCPDLGVFTHEAVAVDPEEGHLYLSEDEPDGCLYRFAPERDVGGRPDLSAGRLEVAAFDGEGKARWLPVPDPRFRGRVPTRHQVREATAFNGGEGIWWHDGVIYFSTKGDNRVWAYETAAAALSVIYDGSVLEAPPLTGVDNLVVSCCGDVLVAEDGGSMQIVAILASGETRPVLQLVGQSRSEITGPAFDPSGTRLYFSSQRGFDGGGITYEVRGPFHA